MPDPDDVELPPTYDFAEGVDGFVGLGGQAAPPSSGTRPSGRRGGRRALVVGAAALAVGGDLSGSVLEEAAAGVVGDHVVVAESGTGYGDDGTEVVSLYRASDGFLTYREPLGYARCAGAGQGGADPSGTDLLACAGQRDGAPLVVMIDPLTGAEVESWELDKRVSQVGVGADGLLTVEVGYGVRAGTTILRWYDFDGRVVWTHELGLSSDGLGDGLWPLDDGMVLELAAGVLILDSAGVRYSGECDGNVVRDGLVLCENRAAGTVDARTSDGSIVWTAEAASGLLRPVSAVVPLLATTERRLESNVITGHDVRVIDPATGRARPAVVTTVGQPSLWGTDDRPVLLSGALSGGVLGGEVTAVTLLSAGGGEVLWSVELEARERAEALVVGDRILVELDEGRWNVLDVADGSVVGGLTSTGAPVADLDSDLLLVGATVIERVDLP